VGCRPMQDLSQEVLSAAQVVWDYHRLDHDLVPADLIFVLGSHDLRVADRAAELFHLGLAPQMVMSGGYGNFTKGVFSEPEADRFAQRVVELGVPRKQIWIENRATHTGENVTLTRDLVARRDYSVESLIAVQKPYMERRTFATLRKQWPEVGVRVTSPRCSLSEYCNEAFPMSQVITIMVGDLHRIMTYPDRGYQIVQAVPASVDSAFQFLVSKGFDQHLSPSDSGDTGG